MSFYNSEETDLLFVYDDGSSISCFNNSILFSPGSFSTVTPVRVRNSSNVYSRIRQSGIVFGFGKIFYDKEQFISIVCAHDVEKNDSFEVVEQKDMTGKRIGYNILIKEIDVVLYVRWYKKIMIGSFKPLVDYIYRLGEEQSCFLSSEKITNSAQGAKVSSHLKTMAKTERALNSVRRVQYRMGYLSDEHATIAARNGYFINLPVSSTDFRYASAVGGTDLAMSKGKGIVDRHMEYVDPVPELKDGELLVEIDIGYIGKCGFLIGITLPFNFGIAICLGDEKGHKTRGSLFAAICYMSRVISAYGFKIKFLLFDSEQSLSKDQRPLDILSVQNRLFDEYGITCTPLPPGVHAKRVERRIRTWKERIRSCRFRLLYAIPLSWIPYLGIAAMVWLNMDPTDANVNMCPPLFAITGQPIDAKRLCVASFGEIVFCPVDNGVQHNSTDKGRTVECVYLHPNSVKGSHRILQIDSIEGKKTLLTRNIKSSQVQPFISLSIVARINNQAKREMMMKRMILTEEEEKEIINLTGFSEELLLDTPNDILQRDSRTVSITENREEEAVAFSAEDDVFERASFLSVMEQEAVFFCSDECLEQPSQFILAAKKEIPFAKARNVFNSHSVDVSMSKEFSGLVHKWHPVNLGDIPEEERKNILPGHGLVKNKAKGSEIEQLKSRFVGGGHRQDVTQYDIYREISTPTASLSSLFAVASHAAAKGLAIGSFDIKQAYLKAPMPKGGRRIFVRLTKIYVQIIKNMSDDLNDLYSKHENQDGSVIVELDYALYGCLESGRLFYNYFRNILEDKMGYRVSAYDDCVFNLFDSDGIIISTIVIHVDDGFVTGKSEETLDVFFESLKTHLGEITICRGRIHNYLGMVMDFQHRGLVHITIQKMIESIILDWNVSTSRNTPAKSDLFDIDESSATVNEEMSKQLHGGIAKLLYLATHVRPDILCATIFLTSRVQHLTVQDLNKFLDILKYLKGTVTLGIMLGGDSNNRIRLLAYADASYGVHNTTGRSHGGTVISYGRGPNFVRSNFLKEICLSSSEAELMQLSGTTSLAAAQRDFGIEQQHLDPSEKGLLLEDNKSAIHMSHNGKSISHRTKHIKVKHFFVKQYLDNGEFHLKHCPTQDMVADILTKPLQGSAFLELRDLLLGYAALAP